MVISHAVVTALPPPTRRRLDALLLSYRVFKKTYEYDPVAFVNDCFYWRDGECPTGYQDEILSAFVTKQRYAVRGPRSLGKTALAAWLVHWFALTRDGDDWKMAATSGSWTQLKEFLWPEIHKWARLLHWGKIGREPYIEKDELLEHSLKLETGRAFASSPDRPALSEGAHADRFFYLYDEAKSIPEAFFNSTEGAMFGAGVAGREAFRLMISTPGPPAGRFYDIHARKPGLLNWGVRHVTLAETIAAGRITEQDAHDMAALWQADSALYKNHILGEFAEQEVDGVIPLDWVEAAVERWRAWQRTRPAKLTYTAIGVDVAREGSDRTVYAPCVGQIVVELRERPRQDTMTTTGEVAGLIRGHGGVAIVDVIGIGAGVVDRLRELKRAVLPFNASAKAERHGTPLTDKSGELKFINMRSAAWWNLRELLDPANAHDVMLPESDLLRGDLVAPRWAMMSGGKIQIESKEDVKKRIGRSTDHGDAVVQAFALELLRPVARGTPQGISDRGHKSWRLQ